VRSSGTYAAVALEGLLEVDPLGSPSETSHACRGKNTTGLELNPTIPLGRDCDADRVTVEKAK
jgi:hypothetical protein